MFDGLKWDEDDRLWFNGHVIGGLQVRPFPDGSKQATAVFMGNLITSRVYYPEARQALWDAACKWLGAYDRPMASDCAVSLERSTGWQYVPKEPTDEMVHAGVTADTGKTLGQRVTNAYQAMLAAAPVGGEK